MKEVFDITALYILVAILLFGFLIFIHEGGHYLTARLFGVTVHEFAIGMGPKVFSWVSKKSGIAYSLRLLPIGGFVSMEGEDGDSDDENAFFKKAVWKRIIVTSAGALTNILFGIIVMSIFVATSPVLGTTTIGSFDSEESVILNSGLQVDDKIVKVDGKNVHIYSQMYYEIMRNGYEPIDVTVIRDGEKITVENVEFPTIEEQGVVFGDIDFRVYPLEKDFGSVVKEAYFQSTNTIKMIWESLVDLVTGRYGIQAVSGPVGVTEALVDAARRGVRDFMYLAVVISMNLGVMNLLPLPALDGGRLLFQFIELVTRRPVNRNVEGYIHFAGLVLLLGFMAFIIIKDIAGFFV
ncbi:MAG: RIP metalloprotease RseP [Ruminococcaceae bacterium]|nr:RIP metalloprotease RseP [Oscillospiraceae bacterium]